MRRRLWWWTAAALLLPAAAAAQPERRPEIPPQARAALTRGVTAIELGEWDLALPPLRLAQRWLPASPEIALLLATACDRAGGRDLEAMGWYRAYLADAPGAANAAELRSRVTALENRVDGLAKKLATDAWELAERMTLEPAALAKVIRVQVTLGRMDVARRGAQRLTGDARIDAETDIAVMTARGGDAATAERLVDAIANDARRNNARSTVAAELAEAGRFADARRIAAAITDPAVQARAYASMAAAYGGRNDEAGLKQLMAQTPAAARTDPYWTAVAQALVNVGDGPAALQVVPRVRDANERINVLHAIATAQAQAGKIDAARRTAASIPDPAYRASAHASIAIEQARNGDPGGARRLLAQTSTPLPPDSWALGSRAEAYAIAGDVTTARAIAERRPGDGRDASLFQIGVIQAEAGDIAAARDTLQTIRQPAFRDPVWSAIANTHALGGDLKSAIAAVAEIRDADLRRTTERQVRTRPRVPEASDDSRGQAERQAWVEYVDELHGGPLAVGVFASLPAADLRDTLARLEAAAPADLIVGLAVAAEELAAGLRKAREIAAARR